MRIRTDVVHSIDQILERHAKLIEVNESAKLPSAYLIAKIHNAKEALELQINIGNQVGLRHHFKTLFFIRTSRE